MLVAYVVAGAGLATALWLPTQRDTANAADTPVSSFTFSDDFDGPAGSPADPARWRAESTGDDRRGVRFTDSTRNASQDGEGHLTINVRPEASEGRRCGDARCRRHTSARLTTAGTFAQLHGRFEARMKLPRENALQPRFALVGEAPDGADTGEIAVVEHTRNEVNTVYAALRGPGFSGGDAIRQARTDDATYWHDFHTYAVQWSPDEIVWSVDGVEFHRATPEDLDGRPWVFDQPAHLVLEVGVGGDPGNARDESEFSRTLTVDYVRVTPAGADRPEQPPTAGPSDPTTPPPPATTPPTEGPPPSTPPATSPAPTTPAPTSPAPTTPPATTAPPTTPPPTTPPPAPKVWQPFTIYLAKQVVSYQGKRYEVRQTHTSLPGWQPPNLPALFQLL
jgi:beta-glucanase (GH16 family)